MTTLPLNLIDETFLRLDHEGAPSTAEVEVQVEGRLDDDRMRGAFAAALAAHPMARARLVREPGSVGAWQIVEGITGEDRFEVVHAADDAEADAVRATILSRSLDPQIAPPLRARLVHAPQGDVVMLAAHHAASDGVGLQRLIRSIGRAYVGAPDPGPAIAASAAHSLRFASAEVTPSQRLRAASVGWRRVGDAAVPAARVAPDGGKGGNGYGVAGARMPVRPIVESDARKRAGATVNDVVVAAAHLAIDRWNREHGEPAGRISTMLAINARPASWRTEIVANIAIADTVSTMPPDRESAAQCLAAVAAATAQLKRRGSAPILEAMAAVPAGPLRLGVIEAATGVGRQFADTAVLSNVGYVPRDWVGGEFAISRAGCVPPAMPAPLAIGAGSSDTDLCVFVASRRSLFDGPAAHRFAAAVVDAIGLLF